MSVSLRLQLFIRKGIFPKDQKDGLPIRNILRNLDESKELHLIPYILAERKSKNTSWYFIPSNSATTIVMPGLSL